MSNSMELFNRIFLSLTILLSCLIQKITSASPITREILRFDASNQFNNKVGNDDLAKEIITTLDKQMNDDTLIHLHISSSFHGDEENIKKIISNLLNIYTIKSNILHITSRMNGITKSGMNQIIKTILEIDEKKKHLNSSDSENTTNSLSHNSADKFEILSNNETALNNNTTKNSNSNATSSNIIKTIKQLEEEHSGGMYIESLDLAMNNIENDEDDDPSMNKEFLKSLRKLLESPTACPIKLCFDACGINSSICRAIAKGIISSNSSSNQNKRKKLSFLHLSNNPFIGDSGAAAIAAALQTIIKKRQSQQQLTTDITTSPIILEELNLSSCDISDAGAKAIAIVLESSTGCIKRLDLSHNRITDDGAIALGKAMMMNIFKTSRASSNDNNTTDSFMDILKLDNNKDIGDKGAQSLATALECGALNSISLRCCSIRSNGAFAFGKAICNLATKNTNKRRPITMGEEGESHQLHFEQGNSIDYDFPSSSSSVPSLCYNQRHYIDLSGNELGVMRSLSSKSSSKRPSKKSWTMASTVTASYFNKIGKQLKSSFATGAESDDDFEEGDEVEESLGTSRTRDIHSMSSLESELDARQSASLSSGPRCGIRSFVESFIDNVDNDYNDVPKNNNNAVSTSCVLLGLRYCNLDQGAIEAVAAAVLQAKQKYGIDLKVDVSLNHALEEELPNNNNEAIQALAAGGSVMSHDVNDEESSLLRTLIEGMADKYLNNIQTIRLARQKAQMVGKNSNLFADVSTNKKRRRRRPTTSAFSEEEEASSDYEDNNVVFEDEEEEYSSDDNDAFVDEEEEASTDYDDDNDAYIDEEEEELSNDYDGDDFDDFS